MQLRILCPVVIYLIYLQPIIDELCYYIFLLSSPLIVVFLCVTLIVKRGAKTTAIELTLKLIEAINNISFKFVRQVI